MTRLWGLLRPHRNQLGIVVLISLVGAAAALAQPLLVRQVLAAVTSGSAVAATLMLLVAVMLAAAVLSGLQRFLLQRAAEGVVLATRRNLVDRLLRLPVAELESRRLGDLISRVGADTTLLLIVAHRLSTVVSADLIVVLDQGRVVGAGRHDELVAENALYRELATTQMLA